MQNEIETLQQQIKSIRLRLAAEKKAQQKAQQQATRLSKRQLLSGMKDAEKLALFKQLLRYDPLSGNFIWLVTRNGYGGGVRPGDVAGTLKTGKGGGYIIIIVQQQNFRANRLAWWFMTGKPAPKGIDVDHENGDRADNKWKNLRLATRSQNNFNSIVPCNNTTGFRGVYKTSNGRGKPWFARVTVDRKIIHLGTFDTVEEARAARVEAEKQYHGKFRRVN